MLNDKKFWLCFASLNGLMALIMGAIAAHALDDKVLSEIAEKASLYQLIHAVLLMAIVKREGRFTHYARLALSFGIILFSGSLYLKSLIGVTPVLAPLGGLSLMAGWLLITISIFKEG